MDESQGYYSENDRPHGLAMTMLLAIQGVVWLGIGLAIGLLW